jgi:diguanylate cyclase (GGDEF)-like protein/PAS domain S-box-containing protein
MMMFFKRIQQIFKQYRQWLSIGAVFLLLFSLVPLFTLIVITYHQPKMEQQIFDKLSAITHLKASQISRWLTEQEKVANVIASNRILQNKTALLLEHGNIEHRKNIKELLGSVQQLYSSESITLITPEGEVLLDIGGKHFSSEYRDQLIRQSKKHLSIEHGDIRLDNVGKSLLDFVIPIVNEVESSNTLMAFVLVHINPNQFIIPYLEYWPKPSSTGETLLVRRNSEMVEFISPLRHSTVNGLSHGTSHSMADHNLPAVVALEKQKAGSLIGTDYRGVEVFAAYEPVPKTNWMLVSKVDVKEASVELHELIVLLSIVSLFAAFIIALVLLAFFKKHLRSIELEVLAEKNQSEYAVSNFYKLPFIGMAILEPVNQRWIRFNDRLADLLGYSSDELMLINIKEVLQPQDSKKFADELSSLKNTKCEGFTFEAPLHRKDGVFVSAILNVKCVPSEDGSAQLLLITIQDVSELKRVSEQNLVHQSHLNTLVKTIPDLVWLKDLDGVYLSCNPMFERFFGAAEHDIIGKTDYDFVDKELAYFFRKHDLNAMKAGRPTENEEWLTFADKSYKGIFSTIKTPMKDEKGQVIGVLGIARDITVRKQSQEKLERLTRLYSAMSQVNEAIVRCDNEKDLFERICQIIVERGGMRMAWVGLIDPVAKRISPMGFYGEGAEYLQGIEISTDYDLPTGQGPTGMAIRNKQPYWCQDFQGDPHTTAWHERAENFGWQSAAALPLYQKNQVIGALNIYSEVLHAFNAPERDLLLEIAADISFALNAFEGDKARRQAELAREEMLTRLTKLAERLPGMVYQYRVMPDGSASFPFISEAISDIYGLSPEDVREDASKFFELTHPDDLDGLMESIQVSATTLTVWNKMYREVLKDGRVRWLSGNAMPERESDGSTLWHGFITDVTETKKVEDQVKLASKVFEQSREGIIITDPNQNILMVNQAFEDITGYTPEESLGQRPSMLNSGRHSAEFYQNVWKAVDQQGYWQGEIWNRRKNDEVYPEWLSISKGVDQQGQVAEYIGIFSDISTNKANEERIQYLAHYDPLTNLVNRQLLMDRLKHSISTAKRNQAPLSLLFVDLDHFKHVNDTLGHHIGDKLLVEISKRMLAVLRAEDTLSRQGGDEFVVVLPGVGETGASHVAEKIINVISEKLKIESYELFITPSIGVAVYPQDGKDTHELLKNADTAMYQAKQDGRNAFRFYTDAMQVRALRVSLIENALRTALTRNELRLNYQPQVCAKSGRVIGAEALVRWTHPELGSISPAEFIPVAEQSGQILILSQWILRTAVEQLKTFIDEGCPTFVMAVNLSAVDFQQPDLPNQILDLIHEVKVSPKLLEVELTEGVAMENPDSAVKMIKKLSDTGIQIAIDDFGTGYSSLNYLKRFNATKLKIDQSFVWELDKNEEDKAIIKAIISLAHSLGLKTIAEGVETAEQLSFLQAEGCDEIQGYYFSKPLSVDEFGRYLTSHQS